MTMLRLLQAAYRRLTDEKRKYTPRTFAEYLRRRGAQVGDDCFIAAFDLDVGIEPYLIKIGNHVAIAAGVTIMTHDGAAWVFRDQISDLQAYGPVVIEDNCFIGYRSILCPNIRIGANSVVAAGSVVLSDVPANTLVMGIPARPFGSLEKYREKCFERWKEQRPPDAMVEPGETWWSSPRHEQNRELLKQHLLRMFSDELSPRTR